MYYIYKIVDPRTNAPFYIGKGKGRRAETHLWDIPDTRNKYKENKIAEIRNCGFEPIIVYLAEDIQDETLAYDIEAELISYYGRKGYEKNGILTNVCIDNRPPNHKGKTYEDIYGVSRAKEQRELRSRLQRERGGYGPKTHSAETKEKIKEKSSGENNGMYGKNHSDEVKRKIGTANRKYVGRNNKKSKKWILTDPIGNIHELYGGELQKFCKQKGLSLATFRKNISDGWPPSTKGKNVGWVIQIGL